MAPLSGVDFHQPPFSRHQQTVSNMNNVLFNKSYNKCNHASRISNYLSIQKDQISVSINSPTLMFRLIRKVTVQMTNDDHINFFEGRRN